MELMIIDIKGGVYLLIDPLTKKLYTTTVAFISYVDMYKVYVRKDRLNEVQRKDSRASFV